MLLLLLPLQQLLGSRVQKLLLLLLLILLLLLLSLFNLMGCPLQELLLL